MLVNNLFLIWLYKIKLKFKFEKEKKENWNKSREREWVSIRDKEQTRMSSELDNILRERQELFQYKKIK